jgi:hypothetical protein
MPPSTETGGLDMRSMTLAIALIGLPLLAACTVNNQPPDKPTTVVTQPAPTTTYVAPATRTVVTPAYCRRSYDAPARAARERAARAALHCV